MFPYIWHYTGCPNKRSVSIFILEDQLQFVLEEQSHFFAFIRPKKDRLILPKQNDTNPSKSKWYWPSNRPTLVGHAVYAANLLKRIIFCGAPLSPRWSIRWQGNGLYRKWCDVFLQTQFSRSAFLHCCWAAQLEKCIYEMIHLQIYYIKEEPFKFSSTAMLKNRTAKLKL